MSMLSENTQAILLLTAPLIVGRSSISPDVLSASEYKALARYLREIQHQPADLLLPNASILIQACQSLVDVNRLQRLLARGFLLSQAVDRWQSRAIWVISRADSSYPRSFKLRLRESAPPILYGCGDIGLLDTGGLAVVGSRSIDESTFSYAVDVGRLAAEAGKTVISGGAKGADQAAMIGALQQGGLVCEVMAEKLERAALDAKRRSHLMSKQLVLVSAYDPNAGFNIGHAMQRNKLIYALADASLVVASDFNKGGTWAGATEQLDKLRFVPVYVKSTGEPSKGLDALQKKGALPWPNPKDIDAFNAIFDVSANVMSANTSLSLFDQEPVFEPIKNEPLEKPHKEEKEASKSELPLPVVESPVVKNDVVTKSDKHALQSPADILFEAARQILISLLKAPMKDTEIATSLNISAAQAKIWLQRLVDEGDIDKLSRPVAYVAKQSSLF